MNPRRSRLSIHPHTATAFSGLPFRLSEDRNVGWKCTLDTKPGPSCLDDFAADVLAFQQNLAESLTMRWTIEPAKSHSDPPALKHALDVPSCFRTVGLLQLRSVDTRETNRDRSVRPDHFDGIRRQHCDDFAGELLDID